MHGREDGGGAAVGLDMDVSRKDVLGPMEDNLLERGELWLFLSGVQWRFIRKEGVFLPHPRLTWWVRGYRENNVARELPIIAITNVPMRPQANPVSSLRSSVSNPIPSELHPHHRPPIHTRMQISAISTPD